MFRHLILHWFEVAQVVIMRYGIWLLLVTLFLFTATTSTVLSCLPLMSSSLCPLGAHTYTLSLSLGLDPCGTHHTHGILSLINAAYLHLSCLAILQS